jgi:hypothetical protein
VRCEKKKTAVSGTGTGIESAAGKKKESSTGGADDATTAPKKRGRPPKVCVCVVKNSYDAGEEGGAASEGVCVQRGEGVARWWQGNWWQGVCVCVDSP